jgi:hypothetical protein
MANGGKRADDEYGVSLSGRIASDSSEPMAQVYPDGPDEEDQEPKKAPNKANLKSTQSSSPQKVESGLTGPAGRKRSQSRDDTEIQHREERPAAFRKKHKGKPQNKAQPEGNRPGARVQGGFLSPKWPLNLRLAG